MAERSPLFLGLVRPPKLLGLPIMYAMVWLFGSVLLFVWVQHIAVLAVAVLLYPVWGILMSPILAGAAMSLSSVTVVSNANRLRLFKTSQPQVSAEERN